MNKASKNILRSIVDKFGADLAKSPTLCDAYLSDLMPAYPKERALLVSAVSEEIPAQLLKNNSERTHSLLADRFANIYQVPESEARQVVDTWFFALQKEYGRVHQGTDRRATRHYLGGVLTGLIVLGVSSAIAVYQVPGSSVDLSVDKVLPETVSGKLIEISKKVEVEPDPVADIQGILPGSTEPLVDNSPEPASVVIPDSLITDKDLPDEEPESVVETQSFPKFVLSKSSLTKMQFEVSSSFKEMHSPPRFFKEKQLAVLKSRLAEQALARKEAIFEEKQQLAKVARAKAQEKSELARQKAEEAEKERIRQEQVSRQQALAEHKRVKEEVIRRKAEAAAKKAELEQRRQLAALKQKKAELAVRQKQNAAAQKQAAANLVRQKARDAEQRQAALNAQKAKKLRQQQQQFGVQQPGGKQAQGVVRKNVAKVQNIARQLMGGSLAFGQTAVLLRKKQTDLVVLRNLLKLTKEDYYQQQQIQVNSRISSLKKKQNALSARYVQHLKQLCSLPAASMKAGVHLLAPEYMTRQGARAVAYHMLKQHTAKCSQVKGIQNQTFARELSVAYGRVLNP